MLAAGRGTRLSGFDDSHIPKSLLRFGGKTLLARHLAALQALGLDGLTLVVGYHADQILAEVAAAGAAGFVTPVHNADFHRGSLVSLWCARDVLADGVLFMDADVLYDRRLLERLLASPHATCFPYDRNFEAGDEPVKLCLKDGVPVEFRKQPDEVDYDTIGEWPGFLRISPAFGARLAAALQARMDRGRLDDAYEEAVRDVILAGPPEQVGTEDITGIPWIEIDFAADVERAENEILPRLGPSGKTAGKTGDSI
jgi:choline kinase